MELCIILAVVSVKHGIVGVCSYLRFDERRNLFDAIHYGIMGVEDDQMGSAITEKPSLDEFSTNRRRSAYKQLYNLEIKAFCFMNIANEDEKTAASSSTLSYHGLAQPWTVSKAGRYTVRPCT